jgi:hypothetical protein
MTFQMGLLPVAQTQSCHLLFLDHILIILQEGILVIMEVLAHITDLLVTHIIHNTIGKQMNSLATMEVFYPQVYEGFSNK